MVGQGCHQRLGDYGATFVPVANITSICSLFAVAAAKDWEIFSFDVKTAFLHAHLSDDVYVKQVQGFPEKDPKIVYKLNRAPYGLKQSAYEFYEFFKGHLFRVGLHRCELDRAVFVGIWNSPPDPSIPTLEGNEPLVLFVPIHVDDGLGVTNSKPLYLWFIREIKRFVNIIDMGNVSLFLTIYIIRDRPGCRLWLSQWSYVVNILTQNGLLNGKSVNVPVHHTLDNLPPVSPNALSDVKDDQIKPEYQKIVGCLMYLALCTRPDIAFAAAALGQHSAAPTRALLIAARGVLCYLSGTVDLVLVYPKPRAPTIVMTSRN